MRAQTRSWLGWRRDAATRGGRGARRALPDRLRLGPARHSAGPQDRPRLRGERRRRQRAGRAPGFGNRAPARGTGPRLAGPGRTAVRRDRGRRRDAGPARFRPAGARRAADRPVRAGHHPRATPGGRPVGGRRAQHRGRAPGQRHLRAARRPRPAPAAGPPARDRGSRHTTRGAARAARADGGGVPARGPLAGPPPGRGPAGRRGDRAGPGHRREPGRTVLGDRPDGPGRAAGGPGDRVLRAAAAGAGRPPGDSLRQLREMARG